MVQMTDTVVCSCCSLRPPLWLMQSRATLSASPSPANVQPDREHAHRGDIDDSQQLPPTSTTGARRISAQGGVVMSTVSSERSG